ncbi:hypothetical protein ACS0TY_006037 [Phlomoides rotata]
MVLNWITDFERKGELLHRYDTFKIIVDNPGVLWDRETNVVHTSNDEWMQMIQANPFVKAYFHQGEPEFDNLKQLFEVGSFEP